MSVPTPVFADKKNLYFSLRSITLAVALGIATLPAALAQSAFSQTDVEFNGGVMVGGKEPGAPVYAGDEVSIRGRGFVPGQQISVSRQGTLLNADGHAYVANDKGEFEATFQLPKDAASGLHLLSIAMANPGSATVAQMQVSPKLPLRGADGYSILVEKLPQGLYQSAYSPASKAVYVTASVGRPPVREAALIKVDAQTLKVLATAKPPAAPATTNHEGKPVDGGVYAVYGIGLDDSKGTIWVTNTRQNTVAVYKQSDLSLVKQLEPGVLPHGRDIVVNEKLGKTYGSSVGASEIVVFDTGNHSVIRNIPISSKQRGEQFQPASLHLDRESGRLYTVSLTSNELAIIDTGKDEVLNVFPLEGARGAIGIDYDAKTDRVFITARGSDTLLIVDGKTGKVLHTVSIGAGPLNVAFDPVHRLAYVSCRASGTVAVVTPDGEIIANLDNGTFPNHVATGPDGTIYAVNKSRSADDPNGDRITRFTPKR